MGGIILRDVAVILKRLHQWINVLIIDTYVIWMIANTIAIPIPLYFLDVISPIVAHVVSISRFVIDICYFGKRIPGSG